MQAIIFIGIQATGKSTFYVRNFLNSHVRISMDLLNTRNKENIWLETCFNSHQRFVVDNTNPTKEERAKYISLAKKKKYEVFGYYFESKLNDCIERNNNRKGKAKIVERGIRACHSKLQVPNFEEGFDKLFYVKLTENGNFEVENWKDEV